MCFSINMNNHNMFNIYYCEYGKAGFRNHDSDGKITLLIMMQSHKDKTLYQFGLINSNNMPVS